MRRYTDLSKEELAVLNNEDIKHFIDLEIAIAGIKPVIKPVPPVLAEMKLQKTETAYEVFGILFKEQADALAVSQMKVLRADYDYYGSGSYEYRYLTPNESNAVKTEQFYTKEEVKAHSQVIKENMVLQKAYNEAEKAYNSFVTETKEIRDAIYGAVNDARAFFTQVEKMKQQYQHYLKLTEGDEKIARNFFDNAYGVLEEEYAKRVWEKDED